MIAVTRSFDDIQKELLNSPRASERAANNKSVIYLVLREWMAETNIRQFKSGDYDFNFSTRKFMWRDKEIYVTPKEQLYLYKKLCLKNKPKYQDSLRHAITNIRKRLGKEFLINVEEKDEKNSN